MNAEPPVSWLTNLLNLKDNEARTMDFGGELLRTAERKWVERVIEHWQQAAEIRSTSHDTNFALSRSIQDTAASGSICPTWA